MIFFIWVSFVNGISCLHMKNSYHYKGKDKLVPPYKKMHDDLHSKYGNDKKAEKY